MTQEEKAKRYDKAIKQIEECTPDENGFITIYPQEIFPELKELEDERIRKSIINLVIKSAQNGGMALHKWESQQMLTWLEKQRKQESVVVIPKFRVGDVIRPKGSMAEYTIESISGGCYHGKGWGLNISSDDDYELVEQKSSWSKEDENMLQSVLWHVSNSVSNGKSQDFRCDLTEWLKSLKLRAGGGRVKSK